MSGKSKFLGIGGCIAMLALIFDSRAALEGARQGVQLCLSVVIPSLFPFFLLSGVVTGAFGGSAPRLLLPVARLLGIPRGGEALVVSTLLGGYPAGAQAVAQAVRQKQVSREQGEALLPLCNQPGPAFLFGMVGVLFPGRYVPWALWGIVLLSAGLTARIMRPAPVAVALPNGAGECCLREVFGKSLSAMGSVCGWVVLFRVVLTLEARWLGWLLPGDVQAAVAGVLELSNGCLLLASVADLRLRFCLAAAMLSFGGLCVALQTQAVAPGLSLGRYFLGKLLQGTLALGLAACLSWGLGFVVWGILGVSLLAGQKRGGNSRRVGV